jgi:hypothetical protein
VDGDLTTAILREIRDEIKATRTELKGELGAVRTEIVTLGTELGGRIDTTNARLELVEMTLKDLAGQMVMLTRYVKNSVDRHEDQIDDLQVRVGKLEASKSP